MTHDHADRPVDGLPRHAGTVVVGGGSAGAAVAGLLAEAGDDVLLLEAGPDYGALGSGCWPVELLDASELPLTHEWSFSTAVNGRRLALDRARVIGGCSSHNGCQVVVGHRRDFDAWADGGCDGWSTDELVPFIERALGRLQVRTFADEEITPYHEISLAAMEVAGIPRIEDLNDLDGVLGAAPNPANVVDGVRFNSAFAYLDPVRGQPNLRIAGDTLCDRLIVDRGRVTGVVARARDRTEVVHADRVVVSAGAYGSPAILQRSGIGDPGILRRAGIDVRHALSGVGRNLQDHPAIELRFAGTRELVLRSRRFAETRFHPEEQVVAKVSSTRCTEAFDLHLYTQGGARRAEPDRFVWEYMAALLEVRSRGTVCVVSGDPRALPAIEHGFLSDADGEDLARLAEGFERLREVCARAPAAPLLGAETFPGPAVRTAADIRRSITDRVVHAYHPGGTCKMGSANDPDAVVDVAGRLHGLQGGYVADTSIMPVLPRANTNLPTVMVGERIAAALLAPAASVAGAAR